MALNLHLLRLFMMVVAHASFSRAAEALFISQPAVSKGVRELEAQLGLPLLERGARGVLLTEAGRALYAHAQAIFAIEHDAEAQIRAHLGLESGVLRVGASTTIATYMLPPVLAVFHRAHPAVTLRVQSANTHQIAEALLDYALDVALIEGPFAHEKLASEPWRADELVLIAAPVHALAQRGALGVAELGTLSLVVREAGSGTRDVAEAALHEHGIAWEAALEVGSTEAIKQTVAAGLGLAIVSRAAAADQIATGKLVVVPITGVVIRRQLWQLRLVQRPISAAAHAFIALLANRETRDDAWYDSA